MNKSKYGYLILILFLLLSSCRRHYYFTGELSAFTASDDIGLYISNAKTFKYNESTCHIMRNAERRVVRIVEDDQSKVANFSFSTFEFSLDESINIEIDYINENSIRNTYKLFAQIVKMHEGKLWFWDKDKKIGMIIPMEL